MKYVGRCIVVVFVIGVSCGGIGAFVGYVSNGYSATLGMARSHLQGIGKATAVGLLANNGFPRENNLAGMSDLSRETSLWHNQLQQTITEYTRISGINVPECYTDANIWTVIKNLPPDPPSPLIVMATRNVDPTSLRTRVSDADMHKHIRFKEGQDDLWVLRRFAVLIRADGIALSVPIMRNTEKRMTTISGTAGVIYRNQTFDLTTNLSNGLSISYFTSDGKTVVPLND
jgi:hypothetical protein